MLRFAKAGRSPCLARLLPGCRLFSTTEEPGTPEGIRQFIQNAERDQQERELAVDTRQVLFTSAASADHRPRIAAAEAFDVAAAALPRPPNFCYVNVSVDYGAMLDAPEVIWFNLCKVNGVTPSTAKPQSLHMLGGAVRRQRLGGGYIQVVLGCVPDLQTDAFTFDAIPTEDEIHRKESPSPAVCLASLDTRLSLQYERVLSAHLQTLQERLGTDCPVVGGLYPAAQSGPNDAKDNEDSVFFVNDRMYKGSAAAVILRSNSMRARSFSCVPSICIGTAVIDELSVDSDGIITVTKIGGRAAFDAINDTYNTDAIKDKPARIFFGITHNNARVPVSFIGDPSTKTLKLFLPTGLSLRQGDSVDLLVDDVELDTETAAGLLIGLQKDVSPVSVDKDITVAREARRNVVASSACGLHFSYAGLNLVAKPDIPVVSLGNADTLFAPTILQRCLGRSCPTSGMFCAGQVASVGGVTGIFTRASTYCVLQGLV